MTEKQSLKIPELPSNIEITMLLVKVDLTIYSPSNVPPQVVKGLQREPKVGQTRTWADEQVGGSVDHIPPVEYSPGFSTRNTHESGLTRCVSASPTRTGCGIAGPAI